MFFSIAQQQQTNFSHFYQLGSFCISTDAGWTETQVENYHVLYKGYADDAGVESLLPTIVDQTEPELLGNFCVIAYNSQSGTIKIQTDRYRGFPIFIKAGSEVTNLTPLDHIAWTDSLIEVGPDISINETKFNVIGQIDTTYTSMEEVVEKIDNILKARTQKFVSTNRLPVKTHLSGGVDSLLVYSYLQKYTSNYEMIRCAHIDYDEFWLKNSGTLKENFWGYKQIHHWNQPCVLTSGAPGDEFMLRSPVTVDLFLRLQGLDMFDLLEQHPDCMHASYFLLDKHTKVFSNQELPQWDRKEMLWNLCNILVNDWQHWHIGNTLTWTPLRDLEIIKLLVRLPAAEAVGQIMDSEISCRLIEQNYPGLTKTISDQKNSGNAMKNLVGFYSRIADSSGQ
jgi:hypothetical protein